MIQFPRRLERHVCGGCTHIVIISLPSRRRFEQRTFGLRLVHMRDKNRCNGACDLVLDCEDIFQFPVIAFGPAVRASSTIDQLRTDADSISATTNAALQSVPHTEFT